jgi:hypothetical protein
MLVSEPVWELVSEELLTLQTTVAMVGKINYMARGQVVRDMDHWGEGNYILTGLVIIHIKYTTGKKQCSTRIDILPQTAVGNKVSHSTALSRILMLHHIRVICGDHHDLETMKNSNKGLDYVSLQSLHIVET